VIFHSSYYRYAPGAYNVLTVYDFIYEHYRSGLARKVHVWQKSRAINHADAIICISEHSKNDLLRFYPHISIPIKVIHMGKSDDYMVLNDDYTYSAEVEFLIGQKFYLFIGERRNYKNFQFLLEQLQPEQFLVIVGGGELQAEEKKQLEQKWGANYHHFLRPDNTTLNEIYNLAFCLLYPSDYDGFGIPVIEAMSAGCLVVCQAVSSLTEVAGEAGVFFDKNVSSSSHGSLQNALAQLQDDTFYQNRVVKGLENAEQFSWDKCYRQTLEFYADSRLHDSDVSS